MAPDLFREFANAFTAEWNKQQGDSAASQAAQRAKLRKISQQMKRLIDAIADGTPASTVNRRLIELERRQASLDGKLAKAVAPAPRLHPNLGEVYRSKVTDLTDALNSDNGTAARDVVHGLIDAIVLVPDHAEFPSLMCPWCVRGAYVCLYCGQQKARNSMELRANPWLRG